MKAEVYAKFREKYGVMSKFQVEGLERALGGPFDTISCALDMFLYWCRFHISAFAAEVHGRDAYAPSIRVRSAYTFARQAIGWSGFRV